MFDQLTRGGRFVRTALAAGVIGLFSLTAVPLEAGKHHYGHTKKRFDDYDKKKIQKLKDKKERLKFRLQALRTLRRTDRTVRTPDSQCGLTYQDASRKFLTKYDELKKKLQQIEKYSRVPIQVGPLIKNGRNKGLINIDRKIKKRLAPEVNVDVCGEHLPRPSVREAVICTVENDVDGFPDRGNSDHDRVGFTNQGREIWAARLGSGSTRVMIVAQQHGNEYANSEAALNLLVELTQSKSKEVRKLLRTLDILIVPRVNIDGGEPGADDFPPIGERIQTDFAFIRNTVDPDAGGGFESASEPNFFGVVGRGYNLNRYNYGNLNFAIRPVESQAIVATALSWRPHFAHDFHTTITLGTCTIDLDDLQPDFTIVCNGEDGAPPIVTSYDADYAAWFAPGVTSDSKVPANLQMEARNTLRTMSGKMLDKVDAEIEGQVTRYAQFSSGAGAVNDGVFDDGVAPIGIFSTFSEVKGLEFARLDVLDVTEDEFGELQLNEGINTGRIDPCFVKTSIAVATKAQRAYLDSVAEVVKDPPQDEGNWCDYPVNVLFQVAFEGTPIDEQAALYIGPGGFPAAIFGVCPGDLDAP